jgi:hypothetical protein
MSTQRRLRPDALEVLWLTLFAAASLLGVGCTAAGGSSPGSSPAPEAKPTPAERTIPEAKAAPASPAQGTPPTEPARAAQEDYSSRRLVEIPLDRSRLAQKRGAEIWVSSDRGQTWVNQGEVDVKRGIAGFLAPKDGRYGFLIIPVGQDGRRDVTPKPGDLPEKTIVVDTVPPVVEVLSPNGGEIFGAGRSTIIQWVAQDANMDPVKGITIEASAGDRNVWTTIKSGLPNSGTYHWDINLASSRHYRIRVTARDLAGNVGMDESDNDFTIAGQAPEVLITGPAAANFAPVKIEWTGGDRGGAGLKRVSLYVSRDKGQSWTFYADAERAQAPFLFQDLDGIYGLRLAAEDKVGNAIPVPTPGTPPQWTLTLDRTKPEVKLISPKGGGYQGGVPVDVQWVAQDNLGMPPNGISLYYSDDLGKTWKVIAREIKNDGLYTWTPPKLPGVDYRFKVVATDLAGNVAEAVSDRFGIDGTVPEARATGPDRSNSQTVQVAYEIRNRGTAPIRKVTLYYRPEGMKEWIKYGDDPDHESPVLFAKADGRYGLYLTCATDSGLKSDLVQKPPDPDTEPQLLLTIDSTPPQLTLESFMGGGYVMAGAAVDILWKMVEPNPDPAGMMIYHSPDGGASWNVVAAHVDPTKGSYRWIVPSTSGSRHKIRLVASDRFGNRGETESEKPFTIDNDLPTVTLLQRPPSVSRLSRVSAAYQAKDATSGVERVILYAKKLGEKAPYKMLAESRNAAGTIEAELPSEGHWGFLLVAQDGAGHVSSDYERDPKPDFEAGYDVTKPEVVLKKSMAPQGTQTVLNGLWEVEWQARDNYSPPESIKIRIEQSSDGGRTWFVIVRDHPNTGKADLRPYLFPGKKYRLRIVAIDEAGNEGEDVSRDFDPGDVPPPALSLRGVEEGRAYAAGSMVLVSWASPDKSITEATVELSKDGGRTWRFLAQMRTGSMNVLMPAQEGRYHMRVLARDALGRPISSNYIAFEAISGVEQVRIISSDKVEAGRLMRVLIEPKTVLKSAKELRLEISEGGAAAWRKVTDVRASDLQFPAPSAAGEYLIRVVVVAPDGKEYDSNHFRFRVVASEAGTAGVQLLNFRGGEVYPGEKGRLIGLKAAVPAAELEVEFSEASGREGSWRKLGSEELEAVSGGILWKRLPSITNPHCRIRVSMGAPGGKRLSDASEKDFAIDSAKPVVRVVGPLQESPMPVRLEIQQEPSLSPIKEIILYVRKKEGGAWELHGNFDPPGVVTFAPAAPGDYFVYAAARSEVGVQGDAPTPQTTPQAVLKVRGGKTVEPVTPAGPLTLLTALPPVIKGGTSVELRWSSEKESGRLSIELVADGKREALRADLPGTGSLVWTVPKVDRRNCQIVLEMGDKSAKSRLFEIKSTAPQIDGIEIELPRR